MTAERVVSVDQSDPNRGRFDPSRVGKPNPADTEPYFTTSPEVAEATTLAGSPPARRPVRRWLAILSVALLAAATLVVWLPFLMVLTAGVITTQMGCRADEAAAYPCFIAGRDMGGTLYFMGMMGWVAIAVLPAMLATALAWLVLVLVWLASWVRRRVARKT